MNRRNRRAVEALVRRGVLTFREEREARHHPLRVPKDWYNRHKPTTVESGGWRITIPAV